MRVNRGILAGTGAALAVAGFMLSPAFGAATDLVRLRAEAPVSLGALGSISSFTPTIKDPRLAAAYAKIAASAGQRGFRFTPTSGSLSGRRSVTVMVRAAGGDHAVPDGAVDTIDIKPMAFSLSGAHNWRKFALPDAVGRKALDPVSVETMVDAKNFSLNDGKKDRFSTKVLLENRRDAGPASTERNPTADRDYSLDLASSYSLTRNLNVTAGIRYNNSVAGRLTPMTDDRRDSQAVYLGTIFKF
ncbi:hypothetical protein U5A82_21150 [Sphingobium sp. CR2-8]|uniref:hypothetical protein n=1 Tax=Sphingobium sp. CR2-8 TaxID=1306534 RepID=UPI002DB8C09A|nr:hypothetical protein [Sphingobium sp. CR2-8]MEC3912886.1 hypothetical protein [Sphingobium sp. CR2-8]